MQQHNFVQGSPEWHAHRARARNASDAPAMLGCSPYMTRSQLLHAMHTGLRPEATADQQRIFDAGHAIEAAQRPGAEEFIGEGLYPVVGSAMVDGIELSASFDGLTMAEDTAYECKTLNDSLRAVLGDDPERNDPSALPKMYRVQMEQQLAVSGAERVFFVAATRDGSDVRRCWYYPDPALRRELIAGWKQLDADLAAYVPPAASTVEKIVAEPVEALPAPVIQVSGQLTLSDNFKVFEERLRRFLDDELVREPKTDEDFATLDVQIKAMKGAEEALQRAEAQMLAQIQSVDQAKRTKDMLAELVRKNRLLAEKLLKDEKERRRGDIVAGGVKALADHVAALNQRLGKPYMPATVSAADFGGAIKGLKSLASMEDKVATTLANAKIEANAIADKIDANLKHLREHAEAYRHLFPDAATLVLRTPEDCALIVQARITEHKAAEERRMEAERARIRAEEEARAAEKVRQEQAAREAEERRQRAAAEEAERVKNRPALLEQAREIVGDIQAAEVLRDALPAAGPAVIPLPTRAPAAPAGPPTLKLGEINARLAPLSITAEGLASLGFPVVATDRSAKLYRESDWIRMVDAMTAHLEDNVRAGVRQGVA